MVSRLFAKLQNQFTKSISPSIKLSGNNSSTFCKASSNKWTFISNSLENIGITLKMPNMLMKIYIDFGTQWMIGLKVSMANQERRLMSTKVSGLCCVRVGVFKPGLL